MAPPLAIPGSPDPLTPQCLHLAWTLSTVDTPAPHPHPSSPMLVDLFSGSILCPQCPRKPEGPHLQKSD